MVFVTGAELIEGGWEFMKDDDYFDKSIRYMKAQIEYMEHDIMFQGERLHCEFGRYKDTNLISYCHY